MLAMVAFVVALAAWQGAALGAISILDATIDGVTSTSAPPGGVLRDRGHGDRHRRGYVARDGVHPHHRDPRSLPDQCVNTGDREANGQVSFQPDRPRCPGEYNAPSGDR